MSDFSYLNAFKVGMSSYPRFIKNLEITPTSVEAIFLKYFYHEPLIAQSQDVNKGVSLREEGGVFNISEQLPPMR